MKITSLEIFRYRIPLSAPLKLAGRDQLFREGLVIRLLDNEDHSALAEVAPLPGWHEESLDEACYQLLEEIPTYLKKLSSDNNYKIPESLIKTETGNIYPSVGWGIETALMQLQANQKDCYLYELFADSAQDIIHINALLLPDGQRILSDAKNRILNGYRTLKVKVGQYPIDEEIRLIRNLRATVGPDVNIRLDANRSWSISEALHFGRSLNEINLEYIEEPVKSFEDLSRFYGDTGIPVGLDESLYQITPELLETDPGIQFLILKPSRLVGLSWFFRWVKLAREKNLSIVITSSFESGITLSVLAQLAGLLHPGILAMGLDTLRWFREDLLENELKIHEGRLGIREAAAQSQHVNWSKLTLVKRIKL